MTDEKWRDPYFVIGWIESNAFDKDLSPKEKIARIQEALKKFAAVFEERLKR